MADELQIMLDFLKEGVIEPLRVKVRAITCAVETADMIIRIDDNISSTKSSAPPMPQQGMGEMGM